MDARTEEGRRRILAAGEVVASHNVYGIVWLSPDLVVTGRFGRRADFVAVGRPITESIISFFGFEEEIEALQRDPSRSLDVPGVVIHRSADTQERYNMSVFWAPEQNCYLLLVARASLNAAVEVELLRHVRARLMAEAEIKLKSEELARANRDLEEFAAIVSHDLKAPMRALKYMIDDVEAGLADGRTSEAGVKLSLIRAQAERMSSMLSGLLDYSSIGRKSRAIETVDTRALAGEIARSLPGRGRFDIAVEGDWPVIDTLKAPLDLILRNLADNAIKHHDRQSGAIRLACRNEPEALAITVSDDGPGIAPEHRRAIFQPFRTLAAGDVAATAGIGMGLALVERTVESVGGTISVRHSAAGERGAIFEVIWPKILKD